MTTVGQLLERLGDADVLVIDRCGRPLDRLGPLSAPATLLVAPVTDALQRVEGDRVMGAVDRETAVGLVGYAVTRQVLESLPPHIAIDELYEAVPAAGHRWVSQRM